MADPWDTTEEQEQDDGAGGVIPRRPVQDDSEMDITPMIDITFLLLIFFLVASVPDPQSAVDLPPALHGGGVDPTTAFTVTIAEGAEPGSAEVYLGEGKGGQRLSDDIALQEQELEEAVLEGFADGTKSTMIIKAEKGIKHRDVSRVASFASLVEGVTLHVAVMEAD